MTKGDDVARAPMPTIEPPIGADEPAETTPPAQNEPPYPSRRTLARWLLVALIAYIAPIVANQVELLINSFPALIDRLQTIGRGLLQQYQSSVPASIKGPLEEGIRNGLQALQANITNYVQSIGGFLFAQALQVINTLTFLVGFLIIPIWLFYVLNDLHQGRVLIERMLHSRLRADFWNVWW